MTKTKTPLLGLDYLMPEQAQKHVTINDALRRLDGLVQLSVKSRSLAAPPAAKNGDRYLIANGATQAWENHDGELAFYEDTGWHFITPQAGWLLWDEAQAVTLVFNGTWQPLQAEGAPPAPVAPAAPPLFTTDEAIFEPARNRGSLAIPSHTTLLGVSMRVLDKISGPTNWKLGTNIDKQRFGHGLDVARGATTRAPSDPPAVYWSSENIVLTPGHGRFTGGRIAVAIHYIRPPLPSLS